MKRQTTAGVVALAVGSYVPVTGTREIGSAVGLTPLVSGLFITAFITAPSTILSRRRENDSTYGSTLSEVQLMAGAFSPT